MLPTPPDSDAVSGHSEAPATPVEAHEPPYYVAVFTTVRTQDQSGFSETNAHLEDLVKNLPGYLGMDHAQTNAEHRAAQERGRVDWYESYTLHVAKVERSHGFTRPQVPQAGRSTCENG